MSIEWESCVQGNPREDGKYYVYISNLQEGNEVRKAIYQKKSWDINLEPYEKIIAWKKAENKAIQNVDEWLELHEQDIREQFKLTQVNASEFMVAESLLECICDFESWFHYNQIHLIDGIYVVKVIF